MIYASIKPIEEYDVVTELGTFGLYQAYGHRPDLLALVMIASPIPYDHEGDMPLGKRRVSMNPVIHWFIDSLTYEIRGMTLSEILRTLNPMQISKIIRSTDLSDLPLVIGVFSGNQKLFGDIVGARATAWALSYRGPISSTGKIKRVSFGGTKTMFDLTPEDLTVHELLQGR